MPGSSELQQVLLEIQDFRADLEKKIDNHVKAFNAKTTALENDFKQLDVKLKKIESLHPQWSEDGRHPLDALKAASFVADINHLLPSNLRITDKATNAEYQEARNHLWTIPLIQGSSIEIQLRKPKPYLDKNEKIIAYAAPAKIIHFSATTGDFFRKNIWRHQIQDNKQKTRWLVDVAFGNKYPILRKNKAFIAKTLTQLKAEEIIRRFDLRYVTLNNGEQVTLDISVSTDTKIVPFGRIGRPSLADGTVITDALTLQNSVKDAISASQILAKSNNKTPIQIDDEDMETTTFNTPLNAPTSRNPSHKRGGSDITPSYQQIPKKPDNQTSEDRQQQEGVNRALFLDQSHSDSSGNETTASGWPPLGKKTEKKSSKKKNKSLFLPLKARSPKKKLP